MEVSVNDVIGKYMEIGIVVSINQRLDEETISLIAEEFGFKIEIVIVLFLLFEPFLGQTYPELIATG